VEAAGAAILPGGDPIGMMLPQFVLYGVGIAL
jgi:hypothetical protein